MNCVDGCDMPTFYTQIYCHHQLFFRFFRNHHALNAIFSLDYFTATLLSSPHNYFCSSSIQVNIPMSELDHYFTHSGPVPGSQKEVEQRAEFIFKSCCSQELRRRKGEKWSRAVRCAGLSQGIEYNGDGYTDTATAVATLRALSFRDFGTLDSKMYSKFLTDGCAVPELQVMSLSGKL